MLGIRYLHVHTLCCFHVPFVEFQVMKGEETIVGEKCQILLPEIWRHVSSSYSFYILLTVHLDITSGR